jgi:hypothetical protein
MRFRVLRGRVLLSARHLDKAVSGGCNQYQYVPVAQLDRASASGAEGYRFNSCRAYLACPCRSLALPAYSLHGGSIMAMTHPLARIEYAQREVVRFRDDVEDWIRRQEEVGAESWVWEDMSAKAIFVFDQITRLESDIRKFAMERDRDLGQELYVRHRQLLANWLDAALQVQREAEQVKSPVGEVGDADMLRKQIEQAQQKLHLPRPVATDEATGDLDESNGDPVRSPGVTRQEVLSALEDERAGQITSLKEITAARTR